ncbi:ABC transporter substrate-binding protein [Telmatospirillum sp.]|uniref:ABC transporter substrate-binding protein n=1 Tax=Telmatospirillum sp. TaxID=2079197 RepID=UPI00283F1A76|nr:ABC transporter substrate-binding protein [Telmatospirillum sp.]MDR3437229.1 ABC transporter substrate-binding protein [Telmatospirillum sp.]
MSFSRRSFLAASLAAGCTALTAVRSRAEEPILVGVSGPLTGPNAQYGAQWKAGFDLALDQINAAGGRPFQYVFEDSQSDPRQSVTIAQKFVNDPRILAELGDFSSPASMAASPIYNRGKLLQLGITNSHPDYTKSGDYTWSNCLSQDDEQPSLANFVIEGLGRKKVAVLHLNTDWGVACRDRFVESAKAAGATIVATEGFQSGERDFRSTLVRIRDAGPDAIVIEAYYADAAVIVRQVHELGLKQVIAGVVSIYSPKFIELAGDDAEGTYTQGYFFPGEQRSEVQAFVTAFRAKYGQDPDWFNATAYDGLIFISRIVNQFGASREAIHEGIAKIKDLPSAVFGKATFDPTSRRVSAPHFVRLVVKDGKFAAWDGQKPKAI